ncbi:redox-sensitive transcriptional activator SoxR [Streptomyces hoynatensis]|uniref:Redox-sensitive transcriptional activator SoxR n=1 Tax=Streptomyces hoynatensis TaxID=1141874 RepID=A0A3A9Z0X9_9ACTN|nr:redox-sensitive transcriptional activator SoxR [Streptomyces hoynatensis]RKN41790.1 redox-sensitive transcriptional activator SoxR [Streptomyces hoynatensis]
MAQPATAPVIAKELTIGQLAQRSGVATSALRFYEEQGLITSRRTSGNQRRYPRDMLRRVAFIRVSQNVGMPLSAIRAALARLPEGRTPNRDDWAVVSEYWRADLDARIRQLSRLRDNLTDCIGCGCLSLESCLLANPDDVCGREGCGPRRLLADDAQAGGGDCGTAGDPACGPACEPVPGPGPAAGAALTAAARACAPPGCEAPA